VFLECRMFCGAIPNYPKCPTIRSSSGRCGEVLLNLESPLFDRKKVSGTTYAKLFIRKAKWILAK
jgi:hypothetical protein